MRPAERERPRGSRVDDGERDHRPTGTAVPEDDLPRRAGRRLVRSVVRPPLLEVVGTADHLKDDVGRRLDVDLALDRSELHDTLLQRLVAHHATPKGWGRATISCRLGVPAAYRTNSHLRGNEHRWDHGCCHDRADPARRPRYCRAATPWRFTPADPVSASGQNLPVAAAVGPGNDPAVGCNREVPDGDGRQPPAEPRPAQTGRPGAVTARDEGADLGTDDELSTPDRDLVDGCVGQVPGHVPPGGSAVGRLEDVANPGV